MAKQHRPRPDSPALSDGRSDAGVVRSTFSGAVLERLPALLIAAVTFGLAIAFQYQSPEASPALDLRPYLGGEEIPGRPTLAWVFGGLGAAVAFFAFRAIERAILTSGFKRHAPAVALSFAVFLFAPAFGGAFRFDHTSLAHGESRPLIDGTLGGTSGRIVAGLRAFAEAPARAYSRDPRLDLPTGVDALRPSSRTAVGSAVLALLVAAGMMLAGIRRTLIAIVGAALTAVSLAVFLPGYLPGAPWLALPVLAWFVPVLSFSLTTAGAPVVRSVAAGLAVGLCLMALYGAHERAPWLAKRAAALRAIRSDVGGTPSFGLETDPARLVLIAWEGRRLAPGDWSVVGAAGSRARELLDQDAPALASAKLHALLESLPASGALTVPGIAAGSRTPRFAELTKSIGRDLDLVGALISGNVVANYKAIGAVMLESTLLPDAAELRDLAPSDATSRALIERLRVFCDAMAEPSSRAGDFGSCFQYREAWRDLAAPGAVGAVAAAENAIATGVLRVLADEPAVGLEAIRKHLATNSGRGAAPGLRRGVAGLALMALDDPAGALPYLKDCWDLLGGKVRDPHFGLAADDVDYWILVEVALARLKAATTLDPTLVPQARRDVEVLLEHPLQAPKPVLPALVLGGASKLATGKTAEGLDLLRAARRLDGTDIRDRIDGPGGRIAWPRYRKLGLRLLRDALGDPANREEQAAVEADLSKP